jgi:hypothetical protein
LKSQIGNFAGNFRFAAKIDPKGRCGAMNLFVAGPIRHKKIPLLSIIYVFIAGKYPLKCIFKLSSKSLNTIKGIQMTKDRLVLFD